MVSTEEKQEIIWTRLYKEIVAFLRRHGVEEATGKGDYLIVDDNYGWKSVIVEIHHLKMLKPEIVVGLRAFLTDFSDWEIVVIVDIPGKEKEWPRMGLTIRKHEVIDGLQRQFMPELANVYYEGGRPGTGND